MADETKSKKTKVVELNTEETEIKEKEAEEPAVADIKDLNLGFVEKQKFRINGDFNRILEICPSDLNVITRYNEVSSKFATFMDEVQKELSATDDEDADLTQTSEMLVKIDKKMRDCIDYIFDTNASEVCAPTGNMFDPIGGQFRYEHIIDCLATLYSKGVMSEFAKIKTNTAKYTNKYKKNSNK